MALESTIKTLLLQGLRRQDDILKEYASDGVVKILKQHGVAAAGLGAVTGMVTGVGATAAAVAAIGVTWSMYFRINNELNLKFSKVSVKSIASAVITNMITNIAGLVGTTVLATLVSFIPAVGNAASAMISAAMDYAIVIAAGIVYMNIISAWTKNNMNPSNMSEEEIKKAVEQGINETNVKEIIKAARKDYVKARKSGDVTGQERVDILEDDE